MAFRYLAAATDSADLPPCFQALRLPLGAPGFVPPFILLRRFPLTAGDRHSFPFWVRARQSCASASGIGWLRLFGCFSPPARMVIRHEGLAALADVDVQSACNRRCAARELINDTQ